MVEHMVIFKFGPETTDEQLDECVRRASALQHEIPGILDFVAGRDFSGRNQGFQVGLTARFEDRAALANYTPHPKHQEFVQFTVDIGRQDIIVLDYDI
ncbi:Dabb family protein [Alicyclobacillus fastidiosus]|uniref:Dabb family protein n=1 Tax=Alicyclobacillus fastidiosus TaxID=392011 RepID=A0ABV5A9K3_9BACL|nr:Dabb family protein [Alicyclobacillus fastidiosus]WEH10875.1 Dabb family protein [Alicyclobacillus fastidiosus]